MSVCLGGTEPISTATISVPMETSETVERDSERKGDQVEESRVADERETVHTEGSECREGPKVCSQWENS